jgi:hypothetical protein
MEFGTDAMVLGIDNRCSACISPHRDDFITNPTITKLVARGFAGSTVSEVFTGTIQWAFQDDQGQNHTFLIPNS